MGRPIQFILLAFLGIFTQGSTLVAEELWW